MEIEGAEGNEDHLKRIKEKGKVTIFIWEFCLIKPYEIFKHY